MLDKSPVSPDSITYSGYAKGKVRFALIIAYDYSVTFVILYVACKRFYSNDSISFLNF